MARPLQDIPATDAAKSREPETEPKNEPRPQPQKPREIGGPKGPEPTRYGDWEVNGRCTDF